MRDELLFVLNSIWLFDIWSSVVMWVVTWVGCEKLGGMHTILWLIWMFVVRVEVVLSYILGVDDSAWFLRKWCSMFYMWWMLR